MKDTFYFSHDHGARNDPKLQKVLMKLGQEGKGVYWDLIEMLYEQDGYLSLLDLELLAFTLRTTPDKIESLINDFDLFLKDDEKFWSKSVLIRLKLREEKRQVKITNGKKGGRPKQLTETKPSLNQEETEKKPTGFQDEALAFKTETEKNQSKGK
ncbi:MAG: hypothetical protein A2287_04725 [Candidatus Melainabacteria bacterium RIFOXYA12_FULL_32_12]|nr:MAG: hypothetical protein A2287_04725 [Candidatus Melainabacteria bacterium RIFOXYA12_FULL_32_12]